MMLTKVDRARMMRNASSARRQSCALSMLNPSITPSIAQEWVDVKERLPALRNWVLVAYANHKIGTNILLENGWWKTSLFDVTHWMPLPEPPGEEAEDDA